MNSTNQAATIQIGNRSIGDRQPCYVIAEVGNNHNGDFDRAITDLNKATQLDPKMAEAQVGFQAH